MGSVEREEDSESDELLELADRFCLEVREGKAPDVEAYAKRYPEHADDIREVFPALELLERSGQGRPEPGAGGGQSLDVQTLLAISRRFGGESLTPEVLERIVQRGASSRRYEPREEVARGGQGVILRVWDTDLRRDLAMKVVLPKEPAAGATPRVESRSLGRFLEEAQVTGQLDHPGIVPVHELGVDDQGQVYFTMKLVQGQDLKAIFDLVQRRKDGWTQTRALGVMLRVCEAMAYAHSKGVIHRDLKPGNVMVGKFGEVYVMDWGLARIADREDKRDIRIRADESVSVDELPEGLLFTMDGDIVGTPAYMSPEQAWGELSSMGPHSDVFSVGAMLYHLLVGHPPYSLQGQRLSNRTVLRRVREGPPEPLSGLAPDTPHELQAICDKAMERDVPCRYADMSRLAEELRSYLEGRVVQSYESGALAELRKWVKRNRGLAASIAATFVALALGMAVSLVLKHQADARSDEVFRLSAMQDVDARLSEVETLWPATPENIPRFRDWMERTQLLVDERPLHQAKLAELQAELEDPLVHWWANELAQLIDELNRLSSELLDPGAVSAAHGWSVARRLRFASELQEDWATEGELALAWARALPEIEAAYPGLRLEPQLGLVPLGADPESGLWEFADLQTGVVPVREDGESLVLTEESSLVFVLLPGGTFTMGAQREGPHLPNHDADADLRFEGPVHEVVLDPFFLSKAEMTQGQWMRFTGDNPSEYYAGRTELDPGHDIDLRNPVESVSWLECDRVLTKLGFLLPTEAQWEYAARAGTDWPWWPGDVKEALAGNANIADAYAQRVTEGYKAHEAWLEDDFAYHAPVGSFFPNAFGLCDVHGNVWEWCRDWVAEYHLYPAREGDGLRVPPEDAQHVKVFRGGSFQDNALKVRISRRATFPTTVQHGAIGLRPAREITGTLR